MVYKQRQGINYNLYLVFQLMTLAGWGGEVINKKENSIQHYYKPIKVNLEHFDLLILYTKEFEVYLKTILFQFLIYHIVINRLYKNIVIHSIFSFLLNKLSSTSVKSTFNKKIVKHR